MWAHIIEEAGDSHQRNALREWIRTGGVTERTATGEVGEAQSAKPASAQKVHQVAPGVMVSQDDLDFFAEMGGEMKIKPSPKSIERARKYAEERKAQLGRSTPASTDPDPSVQ